MFNEFLDSLFDFQNDSVGDDLNSEMEVDDLSNPDIDSATLDSLQEQINVNPEASQDTGQGGVVAFGCSDCNGHCLHYCKGACQYSCAGSPQTTGFY